MNQHWATLLWLLDNVIQEVSIFINKHISLHLKLEIAQAFSASNEWKRVKNKSTEQDLLGLSS